VLDVCFAGEGAVCNCVDQCAQLLFERSGIRFDLEQPAFPVRVGVGQFGFVDDGLVDGADGAVDRGDEVVYALDGLDLAAGGAGLDAAAERRQVDGGDVAQGLARGL